MTVVEPRGIFPAAQEKVTSSRVPWLTGSVKGTVTPPVAGENASSQSEGGECNC